MDILLPTDPASVLVISVLFGAVAYWCLRLLRAWSRVRRERKVIEQLSSSEEIEYLKQLRQNTTTTGETDGFVDRLVNNVSVPTSSVVLQHVRSIFEASIEGARLEIRQRLSSTANRIFRDNAQLKAILSVFIVIGLLGTLYGLAEALATLSANDLLNFEPSIVRTLLGRLKTALAPSIWGVFFTVIGVVIYGYYINAVCQPVKTDLEEATIEHWVPALYPTKSQRTHETLEAARKQLQNNLEAAERVSRFAERVDDELKDFDTRLASANDILHTFGTSLKDLTEASDGFQQAMTDLEDFQGQLVSMYKQIDERQQALNSLLERLQERDHKHQERLDDLEELNRSWKSHLSETQSQLQAVTSSAKDAFESLQDRNEAVVEALRDPIVQELKSVSEELSRLDESTHQGLQEIEGSLNRVRDPISGSAERIERIADTFTDSLYNTVSGVRDEFERQNDERSERNEELARLNENLETLITEQKALRNAIQSQTPRNGTGLFGRVRSYFGN